MKKMLRTLTVGAAMSVLSATAQSGPRVEVWVVLTEPPSSSATGNVEAVKKQQQAVLGDLKALGAVELGRVSVIRNAIAVAIDEAKLPEVKQLSGVRSVSPVRNIERDPPVQPAR